MKKTWIGLSIAALILSLSFISCASSKVENTNFDKEAYYNACISIINSNEGKEDLDVLIKEWEEISPYDTELAIVKANKYFSESVTYEVGIDTVAPADGREFTKFYDEKSKQELYAYPIVTFDQDKITKAADYLWEALIDNPNRLDLYFGLTHMFFQSGRFKEGEVALNSAFDRLNSNNHIWLWTFDKVWVKDAKESDYRFALGIHDYLATLYKANTNLSYEIAQKISDKLIEYFPNDAVVYNFLGVDCMMNGQKEKGGKYLKKAHELSPEDLIITDNLCYYYCIIQDKKGFDYTSKLLLNSNDEYYINRVEYLKDNFWK